MKWISVKDRMPDEWDHIIVCNKNADIDDYKCGISEAVFAPCGKGCCEAKFEAKGLEHIDHYDVTHWMPLPEPPKD